MENGGPAFPAVIPLVHDDDQGKDYPNYTESGMSLRDYFAAQASQGGADAFCDSLEPEDKTTPEAQLVRAKEHAIRHARAAYLLADALLAEREK